jgi:hypothetical protein
MAHPYHHALSSARRWGGEPADYLPIHDWFDESKAFLASFRHRALRHHAEGIFLCEQIFGATITVSSGRAIPVRWVGEQHVKEDLGWIPAAADWLRAISHEPWMTVRAPRRLSRLADQAPSGATRSAQGSPLRAAAHRGN